MSCHVDVLSSGPQVYVFVHLRLLTFICNLFSSRAAVLFVGIAGSLVTWIQQYKDTYSSADNHPAVLEAMKMLEESEMGRQLKGKVELGKPFMFDGDLNVAHGLAGLTFFVNNTDQTEEKEIHVGLRASQPIPGQGNWLVDTLFVDLLSVNRRFEYDRQTKQFVYIGPIPDAEKPGVLDKVRRNWFYMGQNTLYMALFGLGIPFTMATLLIRRQKQHLLGRHISALVLKHPTVARTLGGGEGALKAKNYTGDVGSKHAVLSIPVEGASHNGQVRVQAMKNDQGNWKVLTCMLDVQGRNRKIPIQLSEDNTLPG